MGRAPLCGNACLPRPLLRTCWSLTAAEDDDIRLRRPLGSSSAEEEEEEEEEDGRPRQG